MSDLMKFGIMVTMRAMSSVIGVFIYYFVFWLIFHSRPRKPKEILPDRHIYYPVRFLLHKGKFFLQFFTFAATVISFEMWAMTDLSYCRIAALISFFLCALFTFLPFQKKVDRVTVDKSGVTIRYRNGDAVGYSAEAYLGYQQKQLIFRKEDGTEQTVPFRFLCEADLLALSNDLHLLKRNGGFQGSPQNSTARRSAPNKGISEEKERLYADAKRYGEYLREQFAKLTISEQQELRQLLENGEKINAIKRGREWTGLGLKEAKDMVEQLQETLGSSTLVLSPSGPEPLWTLRITDKEQGISSQRELEKNVDQALGQIAMGREEFVVLSAGAPVQGVSFVQARKDEDSFMYHAEVGFTEKNDQGRPRILYKNGLMSWDVRDLFTAYYKEQELELQGWQELR